MPLRHRRRLFTLAPRSAVARCAVETGPTAGICAPPRRAERSPLLRKLLSVSSRVFSLTQPRGCARVDKAGIVGPR